MQRSGAYVNSTPPIKERAELTEGALKFITLKFAPMSQVHFLLPLALLLRPGRDASRGLRLPALAPPPSTSADSRARSAVSAATSADQRSSSADRGAQSADVVRCIAACVAGG
jgi:hypothetical protein